MYVWQYKHWHFATKDLLEAKAPTMCLELYAIEHTLGFVQEWKGSPGCLYGLQIVAREGTQIIFLVFWLVFLSTATKDEFANNSYFPVSVTILTCARPTVFQIFTPIMEHFH